ncbi:OmpA family protein [Alisedimentitalea sp. MJ-SS2]|uniref:OmpA family protein n=1 Tax=Aliisedimentitalea sp. MJ-SS2 TaxID=3049795 RepID=UPI00290CF8B0|nr:OmpA family protein [Alisedimentitalea sp. MJ-SS2]MDU8928089.1 OmpA family protein [Alisedimentitalea sp. MJ-SS2]
MTYVSKISLALAVGALATTTACTDPAYLNPDDPDYNTKQGALMGAGLGAALGAIVAGDGNRAKGAALGAVVGAAGGVVAGSILDKQEADLRQSVGNDVQITNTGDRLIVTLPQDILFATDSDTLRPDLERDIRAVASNLNAYPDSTVQVLGHTDNVGDAGYNQDLSYRRAESVATVLVSEGVASSRIQSTGRGESQPVASNLSPEGRQQNRRVEIVILPNAA